MRGGERGQYFSWNHIIRERSSTYPVLSSTFSPFYFALAIFIGPSLVAPATPCRIYARRLRKGEHSKKLRHVECLSENSNVQRATWRKLCDEKPAKRKESTKTKWWWKNDKKWNVSSELGTVAVAVTTITRYSCCYLCVEPESTNKNIWKKPKNKETTTLEGKAPEASCITLFVESLTLVAAF